MTSTPSAPPRHATFRLVLAAVLVLVTVASLGLVAWRLAVRGEDESLQQSRNDVMKRASEFMGRMGTYGPDLLDDKGGMPDYRASVKEVISPKLAASFDKEAATAEQLVAQAGVSRTVEVFSTGVSSLDDDSARVLAAGAFTDTYQVEGKEIEQEPSPFRLELALVKIDGEWLVDDLDDIDDGLPPFSQPGIPEEPTTPGESPSTTPSTPPSTTPSESPATEQSSEEGR